MAVNQSRDMLRMMQNRLRKKMKRKGGVGGGQEEEPNGETKNNGKIDIRVSTHVAFVAHTHTHTP